MMPDPRKDMHGNRDPRKTLRSEQEELKETREENKSGCHRFICISIHMDVWNKL